MKYFPKNIKFKYSWRPYQKRVLDELAKHLDDNRLHIVAPPGSGKTILGLEVILRLNKPTLVFAPTLAIRNQWVQRFTELFLDTNEKPDWISLDIKNPKFLTISTYQSLHAATRNLKDSKRTMKILREIQLGTMVVDEAHHLKNEWWKSLDLVSKTIKPVIVGLTATPPYDVSYNEWQRYVELNGPVDAEIFVPELISDGNLCPHQDYVYFSFPLKEETEKIKNIRKRINILFDKIKSDTELINYLKNHPFFLKPLENLKPIYDNLEDYSSLIIFLNNAGIEIHKTHLKIIGNEKIKIPKLNFEWLEILLSFYLYRNDYFKQEKFLEHQEKLISKLKRYGVIERKKINFTKNEKIQKTVTTSLSKLNSILDIVNFEYSQQKSKLRLLILTDFIRKEFLSNSSENNIKINKIGVIPVFELLRRNNKQNIKLGVLSGSVIIIPSTAYTYIKTRNPDILVSPLPYDDNYLFVKINEKTKNSIIELITQIFEEGHIEVLIGTKSLLGEGWDAPAINSLILASFIGSFVLSNQMRGRAIRSQQNNPDKTSNIWHLASIDKYAEDGGYDYQLLRRRFKNFIGISPEDNNLNIENGIERLNLPESIKNNEILIETNTKTFEYASNREKLKEKWTKALALGQMVIEEIKIPIPKEKNYKQITSMYFGRTIKNVIATLTSSLVAFGYDVLEGLARVLLRMRTLEDILHWLIFPGFMGLLFFGRRTYKTFSVYLRYRDIEKDFEIMANAVLLSLIKVGAIKTPREELEIKIFKNEIGEIYTHLDGGSTYEKSIFIQSFTKLLTVQNNPRYIVIRKEKFMNLYFQKDYHAVPDLLSKNKKDVEFFVDRLNDFSKKFYLVYTRNPEGRKILLKSKFDSLASQFEPKPDKIKKWK